MFTELLLWDSGRAVGHVDEESALLSLFYAYSEDDTGDFNVQVQLTGVKLI